MAKRQPNTHLGQAITDLRNQLGSHDKLAARLREMDAGKASRQVIINWEKGAIPGDRYRQALVELGVPDDLFATAESDRDAVAAAVEARQAEILEKVDAALKNQGTVLSAIQQLAGAVDGLANLVETALTDGARVQPRKRRSA